MIFCFKYADPVDQSVYHDKRLYQIIFYLFQLFFCKMFYGQFRFQGCIIALYKADVRIDPDHGLQHGLIMDHFPERIQKPSAIHLVFGHPP